MCADCEARRRALTIAGEVTDPGARPLAEEPVESVTGVPEVHNPLRVAP